MKRVAVPGPEFLFRGLQGADQNRRGLALLAIQISVAGGKREAVRFAHDRANYNLRIEVQVARHVRDEARLLRIFSPEIGAMWLDDFEQLQHYGREDRKSTRLNSSHTVISYAVFCLKKKK